MKNNSKIRIIALCLSITMMNLVPVQAANTTKMPTRMAPGTVVEYDKNGNMQVTKFDIKKNSTRTLTDVSDKNSMFEIVNLLKQEREAIANKNIIIANQDVKEIPMNLPTPKPGMKIFYDGLGLPSIISGESQLASLGPLAASNPNLAGKVVYGSISWYNGVGLRGSDGKILTKNDCATKMGFDVPPMGTAIAVRNLTTDKVITVYKYDVGRLYERVLDLQADAFKRLGVSLDTGVIRKARYFHN